MTALESLQRAVEQLHGVPARFVGSTPVQERAGAQTVWEGIVSQFDLDGHATATRCYAWSVAPSVENPREKFYAVLQTDVVDSPAKAVRASIVADHKAAQR